jgi:hypothetical protein
MAGTEQLCVPATHPDKSRERPITVKGRDRAVDDEVGITLHVKTLANPGLYGYEI